MNPSSSTRPSACSSTFSGTPSTSIYHPDSLSVTRAEPGDKLRIWSVAMLTFKIALCLQVNILRTSPSGVRSDVYASISFKAKNLSNSSLPLTFSTLIYFHHTLTLTLTLLVCSAVIVTASSSVIYMYGYQKFMAFLNTEREKKTIILNEGTAIYLSMVYLYMYMLIIKALTELHGAC